MAVTKVHQIKMTLGKAIDYICNKEKTADGLYISSQNCQHQIAEYNLNLPEKK